MNEQLNIPATHDIAESKRRVQQALKSFPRLADKIYRALLISLHSKEIVSIDELQEAARAKTSKKAEKDKKKHHNQDNVLLSRRWDEMEKQYIEKSITDYAAKAFSPDEIDDLVNLTRKREEAQSLEEIANLPSVSYRVMAERVRKYCQLPRGQAKLTPGEFKGVRVALIRQLISDQLEFIGVAKNFLSIRDFEYLVDRMICEVKGVGQIGGKAAGMFLGHRILESARHENPAAPQLPIKMPESYFLRSDVINTFLDHNALHEMQHQKYRSIEEIRNDYPMIVEVFKNAEFPKPIVTQLRNLLKKIGKNPLIVRSSSLLEDRFGTAFAGKYRSVFLANQGSLKERLRNLLGAISEVYASILHPDPISYRRHHNLLDYDDHMAVLIQRVVGQRFGDYFLPAWGGVAFSRNEYRWSNRLRREDGLVRIVVGLGTRAVDRVGGDYPRMIALSHPTLRPTIGEEEIRKYSQRLVDVINLKDNRFETVKFSQLISDGIPLGVEHVVSILKDGMLSQPLGSQIEAPAEQLVVTFDRFAKSIYPNLLNWLLKELERAYGVPVDIEFSFDGSDFYLLQCRPQAWRPRELAVELPQFVTAQNKIFSAAQNISNGRLRGVEYVVLVDPRDYDRMESDERRAELGAAIRALNERLKDRSFILMGPGRWGSNDIRLGIRVGYSDISHAAMLIEIARSKGDYVPEVSFGTHFFQDLVEARILYLPLYPDKEGIVFNEEFLHGSDNCLKEIYPEGAELESVLRVIDVRRSSGGMLLNVDMNGDKAEALGYLAEEK